MDAIEVFSKICLMDYELDFNRLRKVVKDY